MADERPVKPFPYGKPTEGLRKVGRPLLRCKDTIKDILKRGGALNMWRAIMGDPLGRWRFTTDVCDKIEKDRQTAEQHSKKA